MQAPSWGAGLDSLIRCRESGSIPRRVRGGAAGLRSVDQQSREKRKTWRWRKRGHLGGQERQRTELHPHSHQPTRGLRKTRALGTRRRAPRLSTP